MHCTTVSLQSRLILLITAAEKAYTTYAQSLNAATIVRPTDATTDRVATRETNAIIWGRVGIQGAQAVLQGQGLRTLLSTPYSKSIFAAFHLT